MQRMQITGVYMNLKVVNHLAKGNDLSYFGYVLYLNDDTGINAESIHELFEKIDFCKSNNLYNGRYPINGYTAHKISEVYF